MVPQAEWQARCRRIAELRSWQGERRELLQTRVAVELEAFDEPRQEVGSEQQPGLRYDEGLGRRRPTFSPAAGTYGVAQTVSISDSTSGASIYYTTNDSTPTTSSTKYSTTIKVSSTETLKAIAVATGHSNSAVATASYTITPVTAMPTFSPAAGTYGVAQTVSISDSTSGASIYYTTNDSTPTTSSTKYSTTIKVSSTETLKAIAVATGHSVSAVASSIYIIQ
jgi:hypothetical protein